MDQTQSNPPKKRRRRPIVAFVLVFACAATWWFWPSANRQFVGKWDWYDRLDGKEETINTFELWASGRGIRRSRYSPDHAEFLRWRINDDNFEIWDRRSEIAGPPSPSLFEWPALLNYRSGFGRKDGAWRIEKVSAAEIHMRRVGAANMTTILRRSSE